MSPLFFLLALICTAAVMLLHVFSVGNAVHSDSSDQSGSKGTGKASKPDYLDVDPNPPRPPKSIPGPMQTDIYDDMEQDIYDVIDESVMFALAM